MHRVSSVVSSRVTHNACTHKLEYSACSTNPSLSSSLVCEPGHSTILHAIYTLSILLHSLTCLTHSDVAKVLKCKKKALKDANKKIRKVQQQHKEQEYVQ